MQPTVDRYRYPWRRLVPGDRHSTTIRYPAGTDLSADTFELVMLDAFTGVPISGVAYTIDMTDAATGLLVAAADIPAGVDTTIAAELRFRTLTPFNETVIAGPVVWAPATVPVTP